ncbi:Ecp10-3 [Fulvia fulva]|uniref:Ecp10-3 n=1 Tax=Passalora fulva TaxID=5499 RepID=A0A1P8YXP9_PASFU|nr:Ecp10-3 [Fulvia fulva]AQA29292.1 extracellular protein 10-3 [Fulvia fulva]KAK4626952.1 Ecp10-3 [Fulvia fulva]KAK4627494.1 Ecp10-3 [Fulvia fulva]UJO15708.1 Ecp10-3 [Fulvia fulva]WPV13373.1 Ecp10-3 [Fulvia fulva]
MNFILLIVSMATLALASPPDWYYGKCNVEKQTCEWGDIGVTQWDCDPNALCSDDCNKCTIHRGKGNSNLANCQWPKC